MPRQTNRNTPATRPADPAQPAEPALLYTSQLRRFGPIAVYGSEKAVPGAATIKAGRVFDFYVLRFLGRDLLQIQVGRPD